jgi:hypothetical protein
MILALVMDRWANNSKKLKVVKLRPVLVDVMVTLPSAS